MAAKRRADVTWEGDLPSGRGVVTATTSGTVKDLNVSWASRTEGPDSRTSPEELLAAAHAACFCMGLSAALGRAGTPPEKLDASATVTFDRVGDGFKVVSSALEVRGRVPGIDQAAFEKAAEGAKNNCPISKAITGNVELSVKATLES